MMSVLYNFVRVDVDAFLADPKHVEILITMCKSVCALYIHTILNIHDICHKHMRVLVDLYSWGGGGDRVSEALGGVG